MTEKSIMDIIAEDPAKYMVYYGEALLRDWADNAQGESVELWLDGQATVHPFKQFKASKRTPGGTRFIIMAIEITDDEKPVNQEQRRAVEQAMQNHMKGSKHSQAAAMLCKELDFHIYIRHRLSLLEPTAKRAFTATLPHGLFSVISSTKAEIINNDPVIGEQTAKLFLYWYCGITSRRELDYKPKSFNEFAAVRDDYYKWQASRGA